MAEVAALVAAGKELGYTDEALKDFIRQQQDEARQIRAEAREMRTMEKDKLLNFEQTRELEKEKLELEKQRLERDNQLEKEKLELERQKMEQEIAMEREKLEQERTIGKEKLEHERAMEREKREQERETERERLALEKQKLELEKRKVDGEEIKQLEKVKIPTFNEKEDNFDSYIYRFESIAKMRKWKKEDWPAQLSLLLSGRSLDAFYGLSDEEQKDYNVVKENLLRKYALTEEQFRKQFFTTTIESAETSQEFMARLERLFTKWIESTNIIQDYKSVRNLLIREGFYKRCGAELAAYLREKSHTELKEVVTSSQKYIDAHGYAWGKNKSKEKTEYSTADSSTVNMHQMDQSSCTVCKKKGHSEENCWFKENSRNVERKCFRCGSTDHLIKACTKEKESVGSSSVLSPHPSQTLQDKYKHLSPQELGEVLNVPISAGVVNGHSVMVMRDTGFGSAAVKSRFVKKEDYLDEYEDVYLLDNSHRKFQKAMVMMETEHFCGQLKVLVVDTLVVDCVIGNVKSSDKITLDSQLHCDSRKELSAVVMTRNQKAALKRPMLPLVVEKTELPDRETFRNLQKNDPSLNKYWDLVDADEK